MMDRVSILHWAQGACLRAAGNPCRQSPRLGRRCSQTRPQEPGTVLLRDSRESVSSGAVTLSTCSPGPEHLKMLIQLNRAPPRKTASSTDASWT